MLPTRISLEQSLTNACHLDGTPVALPQQKAWTPFSTCGFVFARATTVSRYKPALAEPIHMDADMGRGFKSVSPKQSSITFRPWCGLCVACSTWMVSGQCISWSFVWAASRLTLMKKFIDWTGPRQSVDAKMIKASNVHTSYLYHIDHK